MRTPLCPGKPGLQNRKEGLGFSNFFVGFKKSCGVCPVRSRLFECPCYYYPCSFFCFELVDWFAHFTNAHLGRSKSISALFGHVVHPPCCPIPVEHAKLISSIKEWLKFKTDWSAHPSDAGDLDEFLCYEQIGHVDLVETCLTTPADQIRADTPLISLVFSRFAILADTSSVSGCIHKWSSSSVLLSF